MAVWQPVTFKTLHIQVYRKSCTYTVQYEANLFLANKIAWKPWFVFMRVIIICTDVKRPQGGQLLCSWILIKVSWAMRMCGFMEPCFRFMMINVFCQSSALYPGQMRAPLFLAPCLFRDNPFLTELTGQTTTGGRSEDGALSAVTEYLTRV